MSEPPQPVWVLRSDGEVVRAEAPVRLSLVPEVAADDVVEVIVGTESLPPPPLVTPVLSEPPPPVVVRGAPLLRAAPPAPQMPAIVPPASRAPRAAAPLPRSATPPPQMPSPFAMSAPSPSAMSAPSPFAMSAPSPSAMPSPSPSAVQMPSPSPAMHAPSAPARTAAPLPRAVTPPPPSPAPSPLPRDPTPPPAREPRSRGISVTGVGEPTPQAPRRPVSAVARIRPIKERDRRASLEVDPGDDSRTQRGRELYRQAVDQLRSGHRSQALSTLRLAASYAPGESKYADAVRAVERGEDLG